MASIPVDKERGIDPHMAYCVRCNEDNGLTLGVLVKTVDDHGDTHYTQRGSTSKFNRERSKHGLPELYNWETVTDPSERIPSGLCDKCENEIDSFTEEVAKGGIYFKCAKCPTTGVLKHDCNLAKGVREQMGIEAPNPVGIEFEHCHEHGVEKEN